jgi:hypothetical protein
MACVAVLWHQDDDDLETILLSKPPSRFMPIGAIRRKASTKARVARRRILKTRSRSLRVIVDFPQQIARCRWSNI